jgi:hypothetical protein
MAFMWATGLLRPTGDTLARGAVRAQLQCIGECTMVQSGASCTVLSAQVAVTTGMATAAGGASTAGVLRHWEGPRPDPTSANETRPAGACSSALYRLPAAAASECLNRAGAL